MNSLSSFTPCLYINSQPVSLSANTSAWLSPTDDLDDVNAQLQEWSEGFAPQERLHAQSLMRSLIKSLQQQKAHMQALNYSSVEIRAEIGKEIEAFKNVFTSFTSQSAASETKRREVAASQKALADRILSKKNHNRALSTKRQTDATRTRSCCREIRQRHICTAFLCESFKSADDCAHRYWK